MEKIFPLTVHLTADGIIGISGISIRIFNIQLVSGTLASTTIFRNGTSSSATPWIQVDGVANLGTILNFAGGVKFPSGCFMDTDSNISYCTVTYIEE